MDVNRNIKQKEIILSLIFGAVSAFIFYIAFIFYNTKEDVSLGIIKSINVFIFCILCVILFALCLVMFRHGKKISVFMYKYRYLIAGFIVVVCVAFKLSGSSIEQWINYLPSSSNESGLLMGVSRLMRSDEYMVNTPMAISQYFNQTGPFPYFNDTLRGTSTDAFIIYGQPVYHWAEIFRPFHWGYLIFDVARGLSFFWVTRLVALFMVSFEFGMLICKKNKTLAVCFAILTTFSSTVQWWFAINGLVEMLIFGQLAILIINFYMKTKSYKVRIALSLLFVVIGCGYILTFYPVWQVSLGYVFLILAIWIVAVNRKEIYFSLKKDLPIILGALFVLCVCMLLIFNKSHDTIQSVLNTEYPGSRIEKGGGFGHNLFWYVINLFTPIKESGLFLNPCQDSSFFSLFPLGICMSLWVIFKEKQRDLLLILCLILTIVFGAYLLFEWPVWLAKITLFSNVTVPGLYQVAFGFINILLLVRCMSIFKTKAKLPHIIIISVLFGIIVSLLTKYGMPSYVTKTMVLIICVVVGMGVFLILLSRNKKILYAFLAYSVIIGLFCGAIVNPVQQGVDVILKNPLYQQIYSITHEDNGAGLWIVEDEGIPYINLPIMAGAPTINCTNTYPNNELWQKLDTHETMQTYYNRYAHITISLTKTSDTFMENPCPDVCRITLNIDDLDKLNPKFILTRNDLSHLSKDNTSLTLLKEVEDFKIYDVKYK